MPCKLNIACLSLGGGGGVTAVTVMQPRTPVTPSVLVRFSSLKNEIKKRVMERVRREMSSFLSPPVLGGGAGALAVNLSDKAAFSTANDSLQEADWS